MKAADMIKSRKYHVVYRQRGQLLDRQLTGWYAGYTRQEGYRFSIYPAGAPYVLVNLRGTEIRELREVISQTTSRAPEVIRPGA